MARRKRRPPRVKDNLRTDGELCVTFVNSASPWRRQIETYRDLLAWSVEVGTLSPDEVSRLEQAAAERPGVAAGVVRRVGPLRGRLRRILTAVPAASDFGPFHAELGAALAARRLIPGAGRCRWSWADDVEDDLDRMLWPVLLSTATLLASRRVRGLRECPNEGCDHLFIPAGRGRPRKSCDAACASRIASRKHYYAVVKPKRLERQEIERGADPAQVAGLDVPKEPPPEQPRKS